jgi:dTDP-glucose 4,6-dehydratase
MKRKLSNILVTGGAGFIGCNFIRFLFSDQYFSGKIINVDSLTYAGNIENLTEIEGKFGKNSNNPRYFFERANVGDYNSILNILRQYNIDAIVNFAAETHVDRSISGPGDFITTNILGTYTLLEAVKAFWMTDKHNHIRDDVIFHHVSTDEVYGALGNTGSFSETTAYAPHSPYSASKASSDHLVAAYYHTYGIPVTISNCGNNYGPYQFPEKFVPLMIINIIDDKPLPIYGNGKNVRDWIYVTDHNDAIWEILHHGKPGEKYNIGGENEFTNIELLEKIINIISNKFGYDSLKIKKKIAYIKDRPGHDFRYSINCSKIKKELNWNHTTSIDDGLKRTIEWYIANDTWIKNIKNGEYKNWLEKNYTQRERILT